MDAIDILKKYWGYTSFRLKQEEVINSILNKKDTLALLPTGGGKSICFQVPAILQEGICIVISPLISLMEEQTRYLKSKGIKSIAISSVMNKRQIETALTNCIYGGFKFLYLSPEKLRDQAVKDKIKEMNVNLIAIDEAHCISEWGHNFRPSYRLIKEIREVKIKTPVLALTATANKDVIRDIQESLNFNEKNLIQSSFYRKNLSYVVVECNDKYQLLLKLLKKIKSSVIVYVGSRKESTKISLYLNQNSISASAYHAGIDISKRTKIQEEWTNNSTRVIVATSAFGLGINKTDVRMVVHMQIPINIESYFQESGRVGRDGNTAYSFLLISKDDISDNYKRLQNRYPSLKEIQDVYQKICDYLQIAIDILPDEDYEFNIKDFCKRYEFNIISTYSVIQYLENEELIKLTDTQYISSKIKIIISNAELYKFQISNSHFEKIIKLLLRKYNNIFSNYVNIDEDYLQSQINNDKQLIKNILIKLEEHGVIKYRQKNNGVQLRFLQHRKDSEKLNINEKKLNFNKSNAKEKLEKVIQYIKEKQKCRSNILLEYFGEKKTERCGICDYCVRKNKKEIKEKSFNEISIQILQFLEKKECDIEEITDKIHNQKKEDIIDVINYLFENDMIYKFGNKYIINKK
jgi:ATP-dependent DNA helicase RecQ